MELNLTFRSGVVVVVATGLLACHQNARAQTKVVPIVGDLFETVPRFTAALKA